MSRDLRQYTKQTNLRLIFGFVLLLFIVGDGLIFLFYGWNAAIMGLICLFAGLSPIVLILGAMWIIDWIARRNNRE